MEEVNKNNADLSAQNAVLFTVNLNMPNNDALVCKVCSKRFKHKYYLTRHIKIVHGDNCSNCFVCLFCSKKFKQNFNMRRHMKTVHQTDDFSKEIQLALEQKRDAEADQAASNIQPSEDGDLDSIAVESDDNSSSACDKITALEQVGDGGSDNVQNHRKAPSLDIDTVQLTKKIDDGKSGNVHNKSTALEPRGSLDVVNDEASVSSDNISVGAIRKRKRRKLNTVDEKLIRLAAESIDELTCQYCLQKFKFKSNKTKHLRRVHNVVSRPPVECSECKSEFSSVRLLQHHLKWVHGKNMDGTEAKMKKPPISYGTYIKCIECETNYKNVQSLRDHLTIEHNLNMDKVEMHFPNMDAFKKWKHELERQELVSYTLQHGFKKSKKGIRKNDYVCHRSGKYLSKVVGQRKRMIKTTGTIKLGIVCTSVLRCEERPDGVKVEYYPHHYGHGKDVSFVHLSVEEQDAINENVSKGIPFEKLLDEIKDNQSSTDHFQLYLIKQKDARFINNAFAADEYNPGVGEIESIDLWVRQCYQMENSPILYYRPLASKAKTKQSSASFLLIIMTEFQRQILMSSSRQVACVDTVYRKKGAGFYLTILTVMDDNGIAFPVAFCLSNKVDKAVMSNFFAAIHQSTGPLSFSYFMSDSEAFIYDAWKEVMEDESQWLWCMWNIENRIRMQLKVFRGNALKKAEAYKTMKTLLECQNVNVFESMFKNYVEALKTDPNSRSLGEFVGQRYAKDKQLWAYCYRKDIPLSTNIHLEVIHRDFHFCCRAGRKKRLDKFLFVVMKLVKYKMLDRLCNILDDEKTELAIDAISMCHNEGLDIASERITSLSDKIWLIEGEEDEPNIYVMREFEACPEHCELRCKDCDICVHMYTCSCIHSVINANMCPHIHAVVWKFLTPHFSPPPSPVPDDIEEQENRDISFIPDKCSELLEVILSRSHEVYKIVRENKCNLPKESLTAILKRLNECIDIGRGKDVSETAVNNSQNVLSVVLPNNCQDLSQYVFVLQGNETSTPVHNTP